MKGIIKNRKGQCFLILGICLIVFCIGSLIARADNIQMNVEYRTYTDESGWLEWARDGGDCSKDNKDNLTGIKMFISISGEDFSDTDGKEPEANIQYSVYSKESNWSEVVNNGSRATSNDNPIKAIKVEISGESVKNYNLEYRVLNCNNVWSEWKTNGEIAGNVEGEENLIGIQAKFIEKSTQTESVTEAPVTEAPVTEAPVTEVTATGSKQAEKIIEVAASQIGTGESDGGWTKYGQWYQDNIDGSYYFANKAWCAMFVSWCANEAGVSKDILTPYAYCGYGIQYFKEKGDWHDRSSGYIPKRGDVIFFGVDRHTGLVDYSENGKVYTIEGNSTNASVARKSYDLSYEDINGYGSPKYQ